MIVISRLGCGLSPRDVAAKAHVIGAAHVVSGRVRRPNDPVAVASQAVAMLAIDLREKKETVAQFVAETGLSFPVLLDSAAAVALAYKVKGVPTNLFLGKDGTSRTRSLAPWRWR